MNKLLYLTTLPIIVSILLSGFILTIHNEGFYEKQFSENNVYDKFNNSFVEKINKNLINYFKGREELGDYYSEREIIHLKDVKNIINNAFTIFYITLIINIITLCYLITNKKYKSLCTILTYSGIFTAVIILLFMMSAYTNFDYLFTNFHRITFSNDYWMMYEDALLINIYKEEFFRSALERILVISSVISLFLFISGTYFQKAYKHSSA